MQTPRIGVSMSITLGVIAIIAGSSGCSSSQQAQEKETKETKTASSPAPQLGPKLTPSTAVRAKADTLMPSPAAKKSASFSGIGKGKATISGSSADHSTTDYVAWAEDVDWDGNGKPITTDVALDNKHKVLYLSRERSFGCMNGGTAGGEVLMAVFGKGNTFARPVGSGWFVAELQAGQCAVPTAGLYGCRFDANGNPTECGAATIQEEADDIVITQVTAGPAAGDN